MMAVHPFHHPAPRCDVGDRFGIGLDRERNRVLFFKNQAIFERMVIPPALEGKQVRPPPSFLTTSPVIDF